MTWKRSIASGAVFVGLLACAVGTGLVTWDLRLAVVTLADAAVSDVVMMYDRHGS
jgi:hypothetical protein